MNAKLEMRGNEVVLVLPREVGPALTLVAKARSQGAALAKAGALAERVLASPALAAVLPPQARLALATAKKLGSLARSGAARRAVSLFRRMVKR